MTPASWQVDREHKAKLYQFKNKLRLVDFPGYGFSKIPKKDEFKLDKLIDQYIRKR